MFEKISTILHEYHEELNKNIEKLSMHEEGNINNLPSYILTTNHYTIGLTNDNKGLVFRVESDSTLSKDKSSYVNLSTIQDINTIIHPMYFVGSLSTLKSGFTTIGDMTFIKADNPLAKPLINNKFYSGWGLLEEFEKMFTIEKAKEEAINIWNLSKVSSDKKSYILEINNIFDKLSSIIKRKAFLERRVHRYINEHKEIFLPQFKNCLFEKKLLLNETFRKADFILERENGLAPLLIELESPVHDILTKNKSLTSYANHARDQIDEWIEFIHKNPKNNCQNDMAFLNSVNIEKLIIIGKGLEQKDILISKKFSGTIFWTYDMLIEEARQIMNNKYISQCKLLNLRQFGPF